jgi:hypothetical protein
MPGPLGIVHQSKNGVGILTVKVRAAKDGTTRIQGHVEPAERRFWSFHTPVVKAHEDLVFSCHGQPPKRLSTFP